MAKSGRGARRAMPSTPAPPPSDGDEAVPGTRSAAVPPDGAASTSPGSASGASAPGGSQASVPTGASPAPRGPSGDPEYLIAGTGCVAGHTRGRELDAGRLGPVPTRRATRIGVFLVVWCAVGIGLVVDLGWLSLGLQLLVVWLVLSALVQRRAGHRGRCWRTRAWRHAWGGLAPTGTGRPTGS